jgi:hypothetical protein
MEINYCVISIIYGITDYVCSNYSVFIDYTVICNVQMYRDWLLILRLNMWVKLD